MNRHYVEGVSIVRKKEPPLRRGGLHLRHPLLEASPQVTERLIERGIGEGTLRANRAAVRRILELRQLALTPELSARLEQCDDQATLDRWLDLSVFAATAAEALE